MLDPYEIKLTVHGAAHLLNDTLGWPEVGPVQYDDRSLWNKRWKIIVIGTNKPDDMVIAGAFARGEMPQFRGIEQCDMNRAVNIIAMFMCQLCMSEKDKASMSDVIESIERDIKRIEDSREKHEDNLIDSICDQDEEDEQWMLDVELNAFNKGESL